MVAELAIDSNRYRDSVDGVPEAVAVFRAAPKIHVPLVDRSSRQFRNVRT